MFSALELRTSSVFGFRTIFMTALVVRREG
jgi:hypothetical protein